MLTDARLYSLPRREADLVFRIRPFDEPEVIARSLMRIPYAAYLREGIEAPRPGGGAGTTLIAMDAAFGGMPDAIWLQRRLPAARIAARSNNREAQGRLCALGVGVAMLPRPLGDGLVGVRRIDLGEPPPSRETWVGYHRDLRRVARLRALLDLVVEQLAA